MKTNKLTGQALDWAVGTAMKLPPPYWADGKCANFSTDWAQGGPIIEREAISLQWVNESLWEAYISDSVGVYVEFSESGPTPLIAAMQCYVASKLGDEVDLPTKFLGEPA
jgi:hypothetical protein